VTGVAQEECTSVMEHPAFSKLFENDCKPESYIIHPPPKRARVKYVVNTKERWVDGLLFSVSCYYGRLDDPAIGIPGENPFGQPEDEEESGQEGNQKEGSGHTQPAEPKDPSGTNEQTKSLIYDFEGKPIGTY
jgi:hypothetical protein